MTMTENPSTEPRNDNGNLTRHRLAKLEEQVKALQDWKDEVMKDRYVTGQEHHELETEIDKLQTDYARISERLTIFQAIQVVYSTVAGIISGVLGSLK